MKRVRSSISRARRASEHNVFFCVFSDEHTANGAEDVIHLFQYEDHAEQPGHHGQF